MELAFGRMSYLDASQFLAMRWGLEVPFFHFATEEADFRCFGCALEMPYRSILGVPDGVRSVPSSTSNAAYRVQ